ncbi:MAG: trimethylamine methyltransferase family protein [SAR324 cluster bacterium]|nr:trimethylamine methyltransferase family protein [SAR324 cluster bacterium]MBL7034267.1 trimethylamine methyltransferase family protein [SAR324 cluster bacterium]
MRRSRRERKIGDKANKSPQTQPVKGSSFSLPPTLGAPGFAFLDNTRIDQLRERTFSLLEEHGVFIDHEEAVKTLKKAGARISNDGKRIHFPRFLVEQVIEDTPKSVTLCGKTEEWDHALPDPEGRFIMRTGTGAHGFIDGETGNYRKLKMTDVATIAAVGNHLDQIGFISHPFVNGVPERTSDIHGFAELVTLTPKHVWIQPYETENVEYLMRICALAAGGESALRKRPIASCIATSFTPLELKQMDVEAIIQASSYGLAIHACSLPTAGGTAPITMPGTVVLAAAEILSMLIVTQIVGSGTAVIATPLIFALDMRTGRSLQSSIEVMQGVSMSLQLMKQGFGLLTHTYGSGSDTPDVDSQSNAERSLLGQLVALSGADILGGVGQLECATVFSPVQAIIDNEIGQMLQSFLRTPDMDDESFAWDLLKEIPQGGNFLANQHTLKHCRATLDPQVFLRQARDTYEAENRRNVQEHARDIFRSILKKDPLANLPDEATIREIKKVVKAGDAKILD